eukprot:13196824-Heterocapsa_arctica.AAC.1
MAAEARQLDLCPLPLPVGTSSQGEGFTSRSIRRRILRKQQWQAWAADGIACLNQLAGISDSGVSKPNAAQ